MPALFMTEAELEEASLLHYSRVFWKNPRIPHRLLYMWEHPKDPQRENFKKHRNLVEGLTECSDPNEYVITLVDSDKWSVETLSLEIPRTIWTLWDESKEK